MKIIISPAKTMNSDSHTLTNTSLPVYINRAQFLVDCVRSMPFDACKKMWGCSDELAEINLNRYAQMKLDEITSDGPNESHKPAILSYEGIQYRYMAVDSMGEDELAYLQEHLRILSGLYGVLKPMDGIVNYRLDLNDKLKPEGYRNLYDFWGDDIYRGVVEDCSNAESTGTSHEASATIINLASGEYSKAVEKYLQPEDRFITITFGELKAGKVIQKGTFAKMARGEMVLYMAENKVEIPEELKNFTGLEFTYNDDLSCDNEYVFIRG